MKSLGQQFILPPSSFILHPYAARHGTLSLMSAADPSHVSPPITVLVVLLLTVGAASAMFIVLVWRATSHRRWVALSEWARERGFRFDPRPLRAPVPPLDAI